MLYLGHAGSSTSGKTGGGSGLRDSLGDQTRPRVWKRLGSHWLWKMMMLEGGSSMIILFLGVLLMTGRELADALECTNPRLQVCTALISGQLCMRRRAVDVHTS